MSAASRMPAARINDHRANVTERSPAEFACEVPVHSAFKDLVPMPSAIGVIGTGIDGEPANV